MLQSNTTALLNYVFKQLLRKWKDEINGCCRYPNFGLMLPSSNKKRLFWNIYQCPYGFSWFATSTLSFLDTPPGNVTGHFMSTNNFLVALPDFAQTLPTYSGSQIWKVLLFSSSKLNWLRKFHIRTPFTFWNMHMWDMWSLFTNIQTQQNMFKINPIFKELTNFTGK